MNTQTSKPTVIDPRPKGLKEVKEHTKALIANNGNKALKGLPINPFDLTLK